MLYLHTKTAFSSNNSIQRIIDLIQELKYSRIPVLPVRCPGKRQAERPPCRPPQSDDPALLRDQPARQAGTLRKPQAAADRERSLRLPVLDAPAGIHRRRIQDGKGLLPRQHGRQPRMAARSQIAAPPKTGNRKPSGRHGRPLGGRRRR